MKGKPGRSEKSFVITLLLCAFFGFLGAHRFYVGRRTTGIIQLLTFGGVGVWALIDLVVLAFGFFKDVDGKIVG